MGKHAAKLHARERLNRWARVELKEDQEAARAAKMFLRQRKQGMKKQDGKPSPLGPPFGKAQVRDASRALPGL